jgi:hypothetical protein
MANDRERNGLSWCVRLFLKGGAEEGGSINKRMRMCEIINIIETKLTEARFPSLRPALLINGELFIGKLNDTHNRVRNDLSDEMRNILDDKSWEETRGFVDSNDR